MRALRGWLRDSRRRFLSFLSAHLTLLSLSLFSFSLSLFFLSLSLFLSNLQQALSPAPAYANRTVDRSRAAEAELEAILKARGGMPSVKVESTVSFFNYKRKKKKDTRDRGRRRRK